MWYQSMNPIACIPLRVLLLVLTTVCGGCAVNRHGFVQVRTANVPGGESIRLRSFGLHLVTWEADAGFTLGWSDRTYVFRGETLPLEPSVGRGKSMERTALDGGGASDLVVILDRRVGLAIDTNARRVGMTIGVRRSASLRLPANFEGTTLLLYDSNHPEEMRIRIKEAP
jgi:hypothetical protein